MKKNSDDMPGTFVRCMRCHEEDVYDIRPGDDFVFCSHCERMTEISEGAAQDYFDMHQATLLKNSVS